MSTLSHQTEESGSYKPDHIKDLTYLHLVSLEVQMGCPETNVEMLLWRSVFLQNSYVDILIPKVMVLEGGAYGRWSGHKEGALMTGISALIKEAPQSSLALSTMWADSKR